MFVFSVEAGDMKLAERVKKYAEAFGCVVTEIVEQDMEDFSDIVPAGLTEVYERPIERHEVYAIMRGTELGYIGITKVGAANRINAHLRKGELANDPFIQWLAAGWREKDIRAGVVSVELSHSDAVSRENKLIEQLHPLFNKRGNSLLNKIGGLTRLELDAGE